mgnify:CR=1 FL=1
MNNKRIDFICIGAVHNDYIIGLKGNYYMNRTNPINEYKTLGGVAFRIAERLSFLNVKTILYSLNCKSENKTELVKSLIGSANLIGLLNFRSDDQKFNNNLDDEDGKIQKLINERKIARDNKDYLESDRIRDILITLGVKISDK